MDNAAFDTLAAARELEAAGMDRGLAEVTALNMHRAGTVHLVQLATKTDLEKHQLATKTEIEKHQLANEAALAELKGELKMDMLKVAVGIVITNAGFVLAAVKFLS